MESFDTDVVVVGAGVVGLAVARALALAGREVLILEKNPVMGEETSARNSEVIHAGIYYPPGTLKARHCRRGRDLLYRYCEARGVGHRRCGKRRCSRRSTGAGVDDLYWHRCHEEHCRSLERTLWRLR